jgi:DNA-binding NarL/FixJ family response regulator
MEQAAKSRVFIADHQSVVRIGLAGIIAREPDLEVCGVAGDATTAIRSICAARPAILLLEIGLPGGEQIDLIRIIRTRDPQLRILIFSAHDTFQYAERALRAGVNGYVSKQEDCAQVIAAIRRVLSGDNYISPHIMQKAMQQTAESPQPPARFPDALKDREAEILKLVGRGYSTRHIAQYLHLSVKTVQCYCVHIRCKLALRNHRELVQFAAKSEQAKEKAMTAGG